MRKLMTLMLGLSLALGAVSISFAGGDDTTPAPTKKKKKKKGTSRAFQRYYSRPLGLQAASRRRVSICFDRDLRGVLV